MQSDGKIIESIDIEEKPDSECYIYGPMDPSTADKILLIDQVKLLPDEKIKKLKEEEGSIWLLRESNQEGMLTAHSAKWNQKKGQWIALEPLRLALTPEGWVNATYLTSSAKFIAIKNAMTKVKAADFSKNASELLTVLKSQFQLDTANRTNPNAKQRSTKAVYSSYRKIGQNLKRTPSSETPTTMLFPEDISSAITCPLSKKTFKDPVVCICDQPQRNLHRGKSYERAALEEMKLEAGLDFYPNISLKIIINYLGAEINKLEKLEKIDAYELIDKILLEKMKNPVITPAGNSYSRSSIEELINSNEINHRTTKDPANNVLEINKKSLVPNSNLDLFISGWDNYYKLRLEELKKEQSLNTNSYSLEEQERPRKKSIF